MPATRGFVHHTSFFDDCSSSDEDSVQPRTPSQRRGLRIENGNTIVTPRSHVIDRQMVESFISPSSSNRPGSPVTPSTPSTIQRNIINHSTPKSNRPSKLLNSQAKSSQHLPPREKRKAIANLYELLERKYDFDERYDSGYNQDVSKALQEKLMTVIKIPEKEAKAVSFAKFRCLQNMSRRSQAYMRANAKRTMKQNKLRRRLLRLPYIVSPTKIGALKLSQELMSSDDELGITHVPMWRLESATELFKLADKVSLPQGKISKRIEGSIRSVPLPEYLQNHPLVKKLT